MSKPNNITFDEDGFSFFKLFEQISHRLKQDEWAMSSSKTQIVTCF